MSQGGRRVKGVGDLGGWAGQGDGQVEGVSCRGGTTL